MTPPRSVDTDLLMRRDSVRPGISLLATALLVVASVLSATAEARRRNHPFVGRHAPVAELKPLVGAVGRGDHQPLLKTLLKDPHLRALDRSLNFAAVLKEVQSGSFNTKRFLREGHAAVHRYVAKSPQRLIKVFEQRKSREVEHLLDRKLWALATVLGQPTSTNSANAKPPRSKPIPSKAVGFTFGAGQSCSVALEWIPGSVAVKGDLAAWQLVPGGSKKRSAAHATARVEVGRAVYHSDVDLDPKTGQVSAARSANAPRGKIRTQEVLKGIGPTRWAGNIFSDKKSGIFTLGQAEHDWALSEKLAAGGVPVYRPRGIAALPYLKWDPAMGWRPMATYARLPEENLRVGDLRLLSRPRLEGVIKDLRTKIASGAGLPTSKVSAGDVVRFFVTRIGRVAGLYEGGKTFSGKRFFYGMLHLQNVSALGEMVDFSDTPGFVRSKQQLEALYRQSGYCKADRGWPTAFRTRAKTEAEVFRWAAGHYADFVKRAVPANEMPAPREIDALFDAAYRQGYAGKRADNIRQVLTAARRKPRL